MPGSRKLGLGTAQLGMNYGISNVSGKFPESGIKDLLDFASSAGVRTLDTANSYGDSEAVLGRALHGDQRFSVVTKTIPLQVDEITSTQLKSVEDCLRTSLVRLKCKSIYGILVHRAENLLCAGGDSLYELLNRWKKEGLVEKIGTSVYDGDQLRRVAGQFSLDLVQIPLSVFDQRMLTDGTLRSLKNAGAEVHARSVFLQGLLLMRADELPTPMQRFASRIAEYRRYLADLNCSPLEAALGFVKHLAEVDVALIGINSHAQLQECIESYDRAGLLDLSRFACDDLDLIDPRRWNTQ
jgi:aryl-alcohol dehydrogenase-like predicted oxidoreductase